MDQNLEATIGLEIHVELSTATKMFCDSKNDSNETDPNVNVCPVCMAHPGTLPVVNKEAVRKVLQVGIALGSALADYTEFDRKNYFYPDLPKGYQLSQFAYPLVSGGILNGVAITRVHLEEDTASSLHDDATGTTTIDYNRAGVPLMELVTEPVMHSPEEAGDFARELQLLLRYVGVSECSMEKGQMRVEANVSVAPKGERSSAYVEIKNLNSFRAMERAIAYEIERQGAMIRRGEKLSKQTLGWDEKKQATFAQRSKEGSADYRYFPDPDLPSFRLSELSEFDLQSLKKGLGPLPEDKREAYAKHGIQKEQIELFVQNRQVGAFFEEVKAHLAPELVPLSANYLANDLLKLIRDGNSSDDLASIPITATHFRTIMEMVGKNEISSRSAKDLLALSAESGRDPRAIAAEQGLFQNRSEGDIDKAVSDVISANPQAVAEYRAGKAAALQFLLGQAMRTLKGADPKALRAMLEIALGSD